MAKSDKVEPAAKFLADQVNNLEHPKTHRVFKLCDFRGQGASGLRTELAEAIIHTLRSDGHMPPAKGKK